VGETYWACKAKRFSACVTTMRACGAFNLFRQCLLHLVPYRSRREVGYRTEGQSLCLLSIKGPGGL
jgi:hypothetical protein